MTEARNAKLAREQSAAVAQADTNSVRMADIRAVYQPLLSLVKKVVEEFATNYGVMTDTDSRFTIGLSGVLSDVEVEYKGFEKFRITMPKQNREPGELSSNVTQDNISPPDALKIIMQFLGEHGTSK